MEELLEQILGVLKKEDLKVGLPNPVDYYHYKGLSDGVVILNSEVDDDNIEKVIFPLRQLDEDEEVEHITFYVNSVGGDPQVGMAIVSCLENMKTPVTIHILGRACSAACYIVMAKGDHIKTVCGKYAVGLIHAGNVYIEGDAMNARDTQAFLDRYDNEILKEFVLSHTKIDEELYDAHGRNEWWLLADDMLKYGIVDEIV
jgi:ATP-dependent protease ClpP protease subunit